jgi:hypothetical protein
MGCKLPPLSFTGSRHCNLTRLPEMAESHVDTSVSERGCTRMMPNTRCKIWLLDVFDQRVSRSFM